MRILGIDPGIGRTGWGVIEETAGKVKAVDFGCLETPENSPVPGRLLTIHAGLQAILAAHKPDAVAIEELFFNKNVSTALVVGQARGVAILAVAQANLSFTSYTPLQVKMSLSGYGRADKNQVGQMVKLILGLKAVPKPDDVADALAIGLTHAFSRKLAHKT
jgi:crossover junction endodeoxyribonuclease RuvC